MPAVPDQLLAEDLPASAHRVLSALWARAHSDAGVFFTAIRQREVAELLGMAKRTVEDAFVALREAGLISRTRRAVAGTMLRGWDLARGALRKKPRPAAAATPGNRGQAVAVCEKTRTIEDDMRAIAQVASRGDGERAIAERLIKRKIACSAGKWHHVKVHRRVERMRDELGRGVGQRGNDTVHLAGLLAGEVAHRWKMSQGV